MFFVAVNSEFAPGCYYVQLQHTGPVVPCMYETPSHLGKAKRMTRGTYENQCQFMILTHHPFSSVLHFYNLTLSTNRIP